MTSPAGDTTRLFVWEQTGIVYLIPDVLATAPTTSVFLDISDRVEADDGELGFKGLAFHPGWATNRTFFVSYCHNDGGTRYVRLSRFEIQAGNPDAADPLSELILINQVNDNAIHNIDSLRFGPDGYLYVGIGDEGPQNDGGNNGQRIDKDIWSALLRIDPDKRPGHLEPNPHAGIPTNAVGNAFFSIPPDNPFIGATQFNGVAVNPAEVRTEFYAVGLRNPWQFNWDSATGDLWLGDVGFNDWEEIDRVVPGGNYGWSFLEGSNPGPKYNQRPPGFLGDLPVIEYPHGSESGSVTGGLSFTMATSTPNSSASTFTRTS